MQTFLEQRYYGIVRQSFDYSCGASSVATILTSFYNTKIEEIDILSAMPKENKYSFTDLANVSKNWGYYGTGLKVDFNSLKKLKIPVVAYLKYRDRDHFTVVRSVSIKGAVSLADPSFGNRTLNEGEFRDIWERDRAGYILLILPDNLEARFMNRAFLQKNNNISTAIKNINDQQFIFRRW
ncbi:MAG: hypothetical protein RL596_1705 [Bacteroidota bacterium]